MDNEVKPPVSDQWSLGLRQKIGTIVASATYSGTRTDNILTFIRGNRRPDGTCCLVVPGYSGVIVADLEGRKAWFDALYLTAERPFGTNGKRWGFSFTYTLGDARETGGDQFSLDYRTAADYPRSSDRHRRAAPGRDHRHLRAAARTSSAACSSPSDPAPRTRSPTTRRGRARTSSHIQRNDGRPDQYDFIIPNAWAYRSVDLQVEKAFKFGARRAVLGDLPGLQRLQLRQLQRLPGEHPDAARRRTPTSGNRAACSIQAGGCSSGCAIGF